MRLDGVTGQHQGSFGFLFRVKAALHRTNPARAAPCFAQKRVCVESDRFQASERNSFRKEQFIDRLAEIIYEPRPAHFERFPCFQQRAAACRIRTVELLDQHVIGQFQRRADQAADRFHECFKAGCRDVRTSKLDAFSGSKVRDRSRTHFIFVGVIGDVARVRSIRIPTRHSGNVTRADLVERRIGLVCFGCNPRREETLHQSRHQFGFRVAPKLQQRLDHLRQIWNTTVLIWAFRVHDVQNVRQTRAVSIGSNARPFLLLGCDLVRVGVADVIGDNTSVAVNLYAIENAVSSSGMTVWHNGIGEAAECVPAAKIRRSRNAVCFDNVQPHRIRIQRCCRVSLHQHKNIAGHQPRFQGKLLQRFKIVQTERVTVLLFAAP